MSTPARWVPWVFAGLVCLLALPPRLADVDRFVTTDELFWIGRSGNFARALAVGQLGQTFQTGHPGVTTMWTALLGMGPDRARELAGGRREVSRRDVVQNPQFLPALAMARRAFGVQTAIGVALVALLAWRVFGAGPAVLGGALLALDPFLVAHSRLVHVDASLAIWMSVAALATIAARLGVASLGGVALSGVATGLALLSKAPALFLIGFVTLLHLTPHPRFPPGKRGWGVRFARPEPRSVRKMLVWVGFAAATCLALWPALWAAPGETLRQLVGFVRDNTNPAHAASADAGGPGLLFYPIVFLLRATPLTLVGLLLLVLAPPRGRAAAGAAMLAAFGLGFALVMTFSAKSFDRYLLPAFPPLDVLAGLGWWQALARVARPAWRTWGLTGLLATLVGLSAWSLVGAWPYGLTYANPLLGGPRRAHALIASGWGEGLDQVAAYLNDRPDAARLKVGMPGEIYTTVLDAQFRGRVAPAEGADAGAYDYVVVYTRNVQLGERPPFWDERFLLWAPEATVTLGGVDYAWMYNSARGAPVGAQFGDAIVLEGYGLDGVIVRRGRPPELRLRWRPLSPPPGLRLAVELRPADPAVPTLSRVAPLAADPGGAEPDGTFRATYPLPVGADLSPGSYVLVILVLDTDGRPLPLTRRPALGPEAVAEPDAVALRGIEGR